QHQQLAGRLGRPDHLGHQRSRSFGLNTSSRAWPTRVNASTTSTTQTPGGTMYHQAPVVIAPTENALSSMEPQETRVGSPRPRKLRVVSVRIAAATVSVVLAKTIGITFGSA